MRVSTIVLVCMLYACSSKRAPGFVDTPPQDECADRSDGIFCAGADEALTCTGGALAAQENCAESETVCVAGRGCLLCLPGIHSCDGQTFRRCTEDGSGYEPIEECDPGLSCSPAGCRDLCADALEKRSYIGCEYYPVFTSNAGLDPLFRPAVVIANPNMVEAQVTITRAEASIEELTVKPSSVATVMLDFVEALRAPSGSSVVRNGAYRLLSSVPVTVHQFNPLSFELPEDCRRPETPSSRAGDGKCNSFSNDASLLLPAHVLARPDGQGTAYMAFSRASLFAGPRPEGPFEAGSPGFVAVVGAGSEPVRVRVTSSAHTLASRGPEVDGGQPSDEPLNALSPGEMTEVTLARGDVLQLLSGSPAACAETGSRTDRTQPEEYVCPLGAAYDLTGTLVEADGPIEVIAGHNCAYVPFDRVACDHLEETMFPLETWGIEVIVPRPRLGGTVQHVLRVMSAADDNQVRFEPETVHPPIALGRAESFEIVTAEHVIVRADKPIAVAQYLVGQGDESRVGDPSMTMAIPIEQYRSAYAFLSPSSYDASYVSIIARAGDEVRLDGVIITNFAPIADGAFQVAAVPLVRPGAHEVHSEHGQGIGVNVYGFGDYTSYMLPGGLDLRVISTVY